ncbi:hypothetical protein BDV29DRAFT_192837 [Aspergillus leporis]|uniref:Heterokaryon incompatibility domain-containing protein n=1 Tax=Aspergillus leporis TaxID=41062 RepID=A0A5N5WW56_9EURO|nr:hypothetical protein BDV29DRAFT_192837 [Aspergillus leporis]
MRLLNTATLELEEFVGSEAPQYAILTHTRGREEVTLQDIRTKLARKSAGYRKVKKYESSAELSEAINSMYHWNEEAEVCYAYLADVPHGAVTDEKIRESRWFSRSWTLQELIAPLTVIFSDSEWYPIGGKLDRQKLIPEITGIPGNFLLRDEVRYASVAQRMSWASWRKTTRSENIAYSLMGLLGICMPILQEESAEHGGGILASSPAAFVDSGNIVPTSPLDVMGNPPMLSRTKVWVLQSTIHQQTTSPNRLIHTHNT